MTEGDSTTCETCGAQVAAADRHEDWHRQLVTIDDVNNRIADAFEEATRRGQYNP